MKYVVFAIFIFCVACRTEESKTTVAPETIKSTSVSQGAQVSDDIQLSTLTSANWLVEIVLDNGKINEKNDWKGSKLTFKSNGTYEWSGNTTVNSGQFVLDMDKNMILLKDSDPELNSEWSIKHKKNVMVWIGTPKYGHHSLQMKLVGS